MDDSGQYGATIERQLEERSGELEVALLVRLVKAVERQRAELERINANLVELTADLRSIANRM